MILYSGHEEEDAPHSQGVALMLSSAAQRALIGWQAHGPRLITASFRTKKRRLNINIIQCYAPTNDSEEEEKEDFYQRLQEVVQSFSARDIIVTMGDMNAKIGRDNTGYEEVMGRHGEGEMNDNGERFANFCAENRQTIGGSVFPHKRIHKVTWISPDHTTENQIDHICICKKFRRTLLDVRVKRGADVASDHQLVVGRLRLKLKRNTPGEESQRQKFNTFLLKDHSKKEEFKIELSNRYRVLEELLDEEETIDERWGRTKDAWVTTCKVVLGNKKHNHKEFISADSWKKIEERRKKKTALNDSRTRAEKARAHQEHREADKEVKKSIKQDKQKYVEDLAAEAEEAARCGNLKDLYDTTKKLSGKFGRAERPVKDKEGKVIKDEEGQRERWKEHFNELLNRPAPQNPPDIPAAENDLPINCEPPSKEEIRQAIKTLRNGKAAGPDNIPAEVLKMDIEETVEMLHPLFVKIWEEEQVPSEWKEGYLIKLPKKGDLSSCSNYRGITLLSVPGKVFNRIILERMKTHVDRHLRDEQAGFRKERSCTDQIATLRIILEQSLEWNSTLYVNFIDYEKAFDSVDRTTLWKLMRHYGIPPKITNLIKNSYEGLTCRVVHSGKLTDQFEVKTGVRQGCLLSPFLFLLAIDWVMKSATSGRRNGIQWTLHRQLNDLDFADDLALLSHNQRQMQEKTSVVAETSASIGLNIHTGKSKVLRVNAINQNPIMLDNTALEEVDNFTYLGSVVDLKGGTDADVKVRIGKARAAFSQLKNIWSSKDLSTRTKLRIFNSNVKSVLLYGSETWRTTLEITKKIQTFINGCLRKILRIHWPDKISNEELWQRTDQKAADIEILQRRWRWIGHTLRKPVGNITRHSLSWNPQGKRNVGRPRNSWRRDLKADMEKMRKTWPQLERTAQDREAWRTLVGGLCPRRGNRRR